MPAQIRLWKIKPDDGLEELGRQKLDLEARLATWIERDISIVSTDLAEAFKARFGLALPEVLNEDHSMIIVGSEIDQSSERIIRYLSSRHGVNINAVTFNFFREQGSGAEHVARVFLIEPDELQPGAPRRSQSKRQPNRSLEELLEMAERAGVGQLYRELARALGEYLQRGTTRSALAFSGRFGNSTKTIVNLIPGESSESTGLRFHVYLYRLATLLKLDTSAVEAHLPESREEWKYFSGADEDYSGAAGYFKTSEEVAKFVELFGCRTGEAGGLTPDHGVPPAAQQPPSG